MRLSRAASFFDRLVCRDAYGTTTFKAQLNLFDDSTRDGLGSVRRVLSTAPEVAIPARRAIATDGKVWLVGESHPDYFTDGMIRNRYTLHQADGLAAVLTFSEAIGEAVGHPAYAARAWTKAAKQIEVSSELFNAYDIFLASTESLPSPCIIRFDESLYIAQDPCLTEGGFLAAHGVHLPDALATVTVKKRTYQPVTDTWNEISAAVPALRMRWQEHFRYFARYSTTYAPGDQQILVRKADVPAIDADDILLVGAQAYAVVTAYDEGDVWSLHGRPA